MSLLTWIIIFSLLGGVLSVIAAASFLLLSDTVRARLVPHLVSFAIGSLLGAAFLGLLPHALSAPGVDDFHPLFLTVLIGLLVFSCWKTGAVASLPFRSLRGTSSARSFGKQGSRRFDDSGG